MTSITRARMDALQEVLEDSLPWLRDGSPQHEPNEVVPFDQLQGTFDLEVGLKI